LSSRSLDACAMNCSNETLFRSLAHTRAVLDAWRADYNTDRPHSRLGWMSPADYAAPRRSAALRSTDGSAHSTGSMSPHGPSGSLVQRVRGAS
jgi:hypothetical protein